jgi:hypothetical protein
MNPKKWDRVKNHALFFLGLFSYDEKEGGDTRHVSISNETNESVF